MSENTPPSAPEPDPWAEATDDVRRAKEAAWDAHRKAQADKDRAQADKDRAQAESDRAQAKQDEAQAERDEAQAKQDEAQAEWDEAQADRDRERAERDRERAERDRERSERDREGAEKEARRKEEPWAEFAGLKDLQGLRDLQGIKDAVRSASEEVLAAMRQGRPSNEPADATGRTNDAGGTTAESRTAATGDATSDATAPATGDATAPATGDATAPATGGGTDPVRDILAEVAAGRLAPDEAAVLIDKARTGTGTATADESAKTTPMATEISGDHTTAETAPVPATTTRLRVRAVGRRVRIIGEPFVSTVAVDGPHVVRQEGDTIVVTSEGEFGASIDGFTLMRSRSLRDVQERVFDIGRELSVRVNPSLAVEVEVTAGSVTAERLPGLEQVRVTAGSARVRDVDGPIDLLVQAGSAQVEGKITRGRSRLRAESGSLQLRLLPGSSVRIRPDVQLGRVQWEPPGKDREEHIVGLGDGILNLEVVMGTATVKEAP